MKEPKFKIGDWVATKTEVEVDYNEESQKVVFKNQLNKRIIGQICGAKRKFLGVLRGGPYNDKNYSYEPDSYGDHEPYLKVTGSVILWEIRIGFLNIPILTTEEHIEKVLPTLSVTGRLPWLGRI